MIFPPVIFLRTYGAPKDLSDSLARVGLRSEGFTEPKSFLKRLKDAKPLACVLDVSGEDAIIILALLKSVRTVMGPQLPLIAIVGESDRETETQCKAAGASAVLFKPFDDHRLISAIAEHAIGTQAATVLLPKPIKWFFDVLSPALASLVSVIDTSLEIEEQVRFCEVRLQPYRDPFIALVRSLRKTDAPLDLVQCIRMYGMRNTRNLIIAMKLSHITGQNAVGFSAKNGALVGDPNTILKYANRTLDHYGEGSRNQFEAFNSGLVLDLLSLLAEGAGTQKSVIKNFIEERHIEAIKIADACIEAGKDVKNLALERHIVSTVMMREAGRVAMALFYPEFLGVRWRLEKNSINPTLQHIVELRNFSVSQNLMAALICQGAPGMNEAYKSVLFFDYPYMLSDLPGGNDSFDLIRVCTGYQKEVPVAPQTPTS